MALAVSMWGLGMAGCEEPMEPVDAPPPPPEQPAPGEQPGDPAPPPGAPQDEPADEPAAPNFDDDDAFDELPPPPEPE